MEETLVHPGAAELLLIFFILMASLLSLIITIIPFWKICSKAGFPGALSLLMIIPVANIILPFYIAFAKWPALEEKTE
jgi:hypothetical protein